MQQQQFFLFIWFPLATHNKCSTKIRSLVALWFFSRILHVRVACLARPTASIVISIFFQHLHQFQYACRCLAVFFFFHQATLVDWIYVFCCAHSHLIKIRPMSGHIASVCVSVCFGCVSLRVCACLRVCTMRLHMYCFHFRSIHNDHWQFRHTYFHHEPMLAINHTVCLHNAHPIFTILCNEMQRRNDEKMFDFDENNWDFYFISRDSKTFPQDFFTEVFFAVILISFLTFGSSCHNNNDSGECEPSFNTVDSFSTHIIPMFNVIVLAPKFQFVSLSLLRKIFSSFSICFASFSVENADFSENVSKASKSIYSFPAKNFWFHHRTNRFLWILCRFFFRLYCSP